MADAERAGLGVPWVWSDGPSLSTSVVPESTINPGAQNRLYATAAVKLVLRSNMVTLFVVRAHSSSQFFAYLNEGVVGAEELSIPGNKLVLHGTLFATKMTCKHDSWFVCRAHAHGPPRYGGLGTLCQVNILSRRTLTTWVVNVHS